MLTLFKPGTRTYLISIIAMLCAMLLQAHTQGLIALNPLIKLTLTFGLTIMMPMIPIFLRQAIASLKKESTNHG